MRKGCGRKFHLPYRTVLNTILNRALSFLIPSYYVTGTWPISPFSSLFRKLNPRLLVEYIESQQNREIGYGRIPENGS